MSERSGVRRCVLQAGRAAVHLRERCRALVRSCAWLGTLALLLASMLCGLPAQAAWTTASLPAAERASFAAGGRPAVLALAANARRLWVGEESPHGLRQVDPDTGDTLALAPLSSRPLALAANAAGTYAYLLTADGALYRVQAASSAATSMLRVNVALGDAVALAWSPDEAQLAVADRAGQRIVLLDAATRTVRRTLTLTERPVALAYSAGGGRLLVGTAAGNVFAFDARTGTPLSTTRVGGEIRALADWADADRAAALYHAPGQAAPSGLSVVDPAGAQVSAVTPLPAEPQRLVLDAGTPRAYVSLSDRLVRVDLANNRVEAHYPLPLAAAALALDARAGRLLIAPADDALLLRLDPGGFVPAAGAAPLDLVTVQVHPRTDDTLALGVNPPRLIRERADGARDVLPLLHTPQAVVLDTSANVALAAFGDASIGFVPLTGALALESRRLTLPEKITTMAVDSTRSLAVALGEGANVYLVDTAKRRLAESLPATRAYRALAVHAARGTAYLADATDSLALLDLSTRTLKPPIRLPFVPRALAVSEAHDVAVFGAADGKLYVLDLKRLDDAASPATLAASDFAQYDVPKDPRALAIQIGAGVAVIASPEAQTLSLLHLDAGTLASAFAQIPRPLALAVSVQRNQAVLAVAGQSTLVRVALPNPVPRLEALNPDQAGVGSATFGLAVSGQRFVGASRVWFGTTPLVTRWLSPTRLTAQVPASLLAAPGRIDVTVRNPAPAGGVSNALPFTITGDAPVLATLTPNSVPGDGQTRSFTLTGSGFRAGASVLVGRTSYPATVASATSATFTLPGAALDGPGLLQVRLVNPDGVQSNALGLTLQPVVRMPSISAITPNLAAVGTVITIDGANFGATPAANTVRFTPNLVAPVLSASPTRLTVAVPPNADSGAVSVTTGWGTAYYPQFKVQREQDADVVIAPNPVALLQGTTHPVAVKLASTGTQPFSALAALSLAGLPAGVTAKIDPATISATQSATVWLTAAANAAVGRSAATVRAEWHANGEARSKSQRLTLNVQANSGTTGVQGRFVDPAGRGIAGVVVRADVAGEIKGQSTSDAAGYFQLTGLPGGAATLKMDATPANPGYPMWPYTLTLQSNQFITLSPWTLNPPPAPERYVAIANATQAQQITDARYPGLAITLPAGVQIIGWEGQPKTKIAVERIEPDKLPVPAPPFPLREAYQLHFGTPMGGIPSAPIPVTLPNVTDLEPGDETAIWYYDGSPMGGTGEWKVAGMGTVSPDGKTVASNPGVGIPRFCGVCGLVSLSCPPAPKPPQNGPICNPPASGNPIDLFTGQALASTSGLRCGGLTPIDTGMSYNSVDAFNNRAGTIASFGYGWTSDYDIAFLPFDGVQKRLVLPGAQFVNLVDDGSGTYRPVDDPRFDGAAMRATNQSANEWELRFKDGRVWRFKPFPGISGVIRGGPPTFATELIDAQGNSLQIARQSNGHINAVGSPARNVVYGYGGNGFVDTLTDSAGQRYRYTYTATSEPRIETITDADGKVTRYSYVGDDEIAEAPACAGTQAAFGQRIKTIHYPGRATPTTNEYGSARRVLRQTAYDGTEQRFSYQVSGACVTHVNTPSVKCAGPTCPTEDSWENYQAGWRFHGGKVIAATVTRADGTTTRTRFNPRGLPLETTDALGQTSTRTYDAQNRLLKSLDALGRSTQYAYDPQGNLTRLTDALDRQTDIGYDGKWAKPTSVSRLLGTEAIVTQRQYDGQTGVMKLAIDALGNRTSFGYSPRGELTAVTDALGHTGTLGYNEAGDLMVLTDALGNDTRLATDAIGRVIKRTDPLGFDTGYTYTGQSQPAETIDALGGRTTFAYDAAGRLRSVTDPLGHAVETYSYDDGDRLTRKTDAVGKSSSYAYDVLGRLSQLTDRKGQVASLTYDANDRPKTLTLADGTVQTRTYDAAGRLSEIREGTSVISYGYDLVDRVTSVVTLNSVGRSELTLEYDALDRRIKRTQRFNGALVDETVYGYDKASRLTEVRYSSSALNVPTQVTSYTWDAANRLTTKRLPSGITQTYAYDNADRLLSITIRRADGTQMEQVVYTYDAKGQRTSQTSGIGVVQETPIEASYDNANRMTSLTVNPGTAQEKRYTLAYDDEGNLRSRTEQGSGATTTFNWDNRNRLVGINGPGVTATFAYDPLGRRITKTINGVTTQFVYDGLQAIGEVRSGAIDAALLTTFNLDEVIARFAKAGAATNARHYLTDAIGSVIAQAKPDQSIVNWYGYSPYGETATSANDEGNPIQYTARENDGPIGINGGAFYFYRLRTRDPVMKGWMAEDPIGITGGLNRYAYVRGDPISLIDPLGLVDLNLFSKSESIHSSAELTPSPSGIYTVGGHGNPSSMTNANDKTLTPKALAEIIKNDSKSQGKTIQLLSCNTGVGKNSFAEQLAKELKQPVMGPSNYVWYYSDGKTVVAPAIGGNLSSGPNLKAPGGYTTFQP